MRGALVLVGFMGAGKSTAAATLADALGVTAVDTDALLEQRFGTPVQEVFATQGEAAFRAAEEEEVSKALDAAQDGDVVALGGGSLGSARVLAALQRHTTVLLDVDLDTAWARASGSGRPLAQDRDAFAALLAARRATYDTVADVVLPMGDRDLPRRALPAIRAFGDAPYGTRLLWAHTASGDHPVWVGHGIAGGVPLPDGRRFCVTDANVADLHVGTLNDLAGLIEIAPGEEHKTLATCEAVWRAFAEQGVRRSDLVVALGGGVVGDLAGFVAATYQRGMPVVQVPTTLVAQVDSAYGGKTGVDLPEAKNYVGAYHQPSAVVTDTAFLETLPVEEQAAGYAEVVKTALIAGGALWDRVGAGEPVDDDVVLGCARTKLAVVAADERDGGRRQVLNLGHTLGHALETVTGYGRYRHGEAVGLGLLAALRLSGQDALRDQVEGLLARAGLPTAIDPAIDPDAVVAATAKDKKRVGETTPYVLVGAPGDVTHGHQVRDGDARAAIAELVSA